MRAIKNMQGQIWDFWEKAPMRQGHIIVGYLI